MSNENKIGSDDADELWVENENENDGADDLGGTISTARSCRLVWGGARSSSLSLLSSLSLSLSLSLFACLRARKWFEGKTEPAFIFRVKGFNLMVKVNDFPENSISMRNQTDEKM